MTEQEQRIACAEEMGWVNNGPTGFPWQSPGGGFRTSCPNYPSDINAAITLVDKLAEKYLFEAITNLGKWKVRLKIAGLVYIYHGDTLPLAICRAFLEVKERWKE